MDASNFSHFLGVGYGVRAVLWVWETIIFKLIDRDPHRRYQSATQLQLDLQRFLDDKPVAAPRVTQREQLWRWCRRNPLVAGLLGALLAVFLLGFVGVTVQWQRAEKNAENAQQHAVQAGRSTKQAVQQADLAEQAACRVRRSAWGQSRDSV